MINSALISISHYRARHLERVRPFKRQPNVHECSFYKSIFLLVISYIHVLITTKPQESQRIKSNKKYIYIYIYVCVNTFCEQNRYVWLILSFTSTIIHCVNVLLILFIFSHERTRAWFLLSFQICKFISKQPISVL